MQEILREIREGARLFVKMVFSAPAKKSPALSEKLSLTRAEENKNGTLFFAEEFIGTKAFHHSLTEEELIPFLTEKAEACRFRQVNLFSPEGEIAFRISKKGQISRSVNKKSTATAPLSHNRQKRYRIAEGDRVPFMVDLGVLSKEYKVISSKYDKFRQINRFIEILDHAFQDYPKESISVLDFGCGKSYLTFFVYYYFSVLQKKRVSIIGYDLKEDVVASCNALAQRYGYHGLKFVVADVTRDRLSEDPIDFVISLHACDIATDYALNFALEREVPYIFSVPCCQHEVGGSIRKGGGDLDLFLDHGLFRERMSALLTDAFRTRILECEGYRTDVLEFVDFAHSPKNLMIRAKRKPHAPKKSMAPLFQMEEQYGFRQTLLHLREEAKHV